MSTVSRFLRNAKQSTALAAATALCCLSAQADAAVAIRAQDFLNGLGVNTHTIYTDSQYANVGQTVSAMSYLGLRLIRDVAPNPKNAGQGSYATLVQAGLRMDLFTGGDAPGGTQPPATVVSAMAALAQTYPGSVHSVEGPNEVNNGPVSYAGLTGLSGAQAFQAALYSQVRATPSLASIPVYNFTDYPDAAGKADYANFHSYPVGLQSCTGGGLTSNMKSQMAVMPGKAAVNTELGASTRPQPGSFDQTSHARFLVACALDNAAAGVKETYFYQLFDAYNDPSGSNSQDHFGLFDSSYKPKVAATAIRNLVKIVGEAGANETTFAPGSMPYTVNGPSTIASVLMQKASGWWAIGVWNEVPLYSEANGGTALNPSAKVTLQLPSAHAQIWVNDVVTGSAYQISNTASPQFTVGPDPLFIVISP